MTRALAHRGPDDEGFFSEGPVTLGFRRLAVIDLETGQQPISLAEPALTIVFNGELYNFRELRGELEARGHVFTTRGDVEVVLRLWAEYGASSIERLNGMFAFALWDGDRQTLFLARDRFGIKPLYLCRHAGGTAFASEVRALLAGGFVSTSELDPAELRHYLYYGYASPTRTLLRQVVQLPPATLVELGPEGEEKRRVYWQPPEGDAGAAAPDEVEDRLLAGLDEAVARQMVADVPVGVFLSGGLDSSTITALATRRSSEALRTFSVGFEGPGAVSELPYAREVADTLQSEHTELMMDPATVARDVDRILEDLDTPLADPTVLPTWYMSKLARSEVTVALSGEGADEIFGGYARQRYDVIIDRCGAFGRRVLPIGLAITGRRPSERLLRRCRMAPGLTRQLDWGRLFSAGEVDGLLVDDSSSEESMAAPYTDLRNSWHERAVRDPVNARLFGDQSTFLPGDLLPKVDRMSMAHSLEVRVPFLDNEVADLVLPLSGRYKQSWLRDKILLRRAVAPVLPASVSRRRKRGFEVPISAWLRGPLRPVLVDRLTHTDLLGSGVLRKDAVTSLAADHLSGAADHGRRLWTLLVLAHWLEGRTSP